MKTLLKTRAFFVILWLLLPAVSHGQTYKWIDEKGVIHFQDHKPANVSPSKVETLTDEQLKFNNYADSVNGNDGKSYYPPSASEKLPKEEVEKKSSTRYAKNQKVELYVTSWCGYCKKAKAFFNSRRISFIEYDVEKDKNAAARHRELNRRGGVPVAVINGNKILGFSESSYERALKKR